MGITYNGITAGKTLHVLLPGAGVAGADVLIDLVAGTGNQVILYTVTDAAMVTAGVQAGTWSGTVLTDTVDNHDIATNTVDGTIDPFYFDGAVVSAPPGDLSTIDAVEIIVPSTGLYNGADSIVFTVRNTSGALADAVSTPVATLTKISGPLTMSLDEFDPVLNTGTGKYNVNVEGLSLGVFSDTFYRVALTWRLAGDTVDRNISAVIRVGNASITTTDLSDAAEGGGGDNTVSADEVHESRTWYAGREGHRARNIITLNAWDTGVVTLAADFSDVLNPDTALLSIDSMTLTDDASQAVVAATNLMKQRNLRSVNADVAAIATAGEHTALWTVSTIDGSVLTLIGKLVIQHTV